MRAFGAVGLVEHFVPAVRVEIEGDVREPGVAVAVDQRLQPRKAVVDRVLVAEENVGRQVLADPGDLNRIAQAGGDAREAAGAVGLPREAAERIGDIGVHLGLVARQPVEGRARLDAPHPHLVQPLGRSRPVAERRRAGEHQAVDGVRVVEHIGLGEERSEAMPQEDPPQVRMPAADHAGELVQVPDHQLRAPVSEIAKRLWAGGREAVAAVVVGVDHPAGPHQQLQRRAVAPGVLAHPVRHLQHGVRVTASSAQWKPAMGIPSTPLNWKVRSEIATCRPFQPARARSKTP